MRKPSEPSPSLSMRMRSLRPLGIFALLAAALVAALLQRQDLPRATAEETDLPETIPAAVPGNSAGGLLASQQPPSFLGARSCAAVACHGSVSGSERFPRSRRNEFVHWLDKDPHARAFQTLEKPASIEIMRRLEIVDAEGNVTNRAEVLANCYGCHNPQPANQAVTFFQREGVSCEICHGPAEQWIGAHVSTGWAERKEAGAAAGLGFIDTKNLPTRAQVCAECHVGSPGREVNHDLIAVGHPPLKFEFTAYHDMLPKHWRDSAERKSKPGFELDLWVAGQVASAQAALELLQWRAQRAVSAAEDPNVAAVWPEFAEYDCFACHHDLVHPSWWQQQPRDGRPAGMASWGIWYYGLLKQSGAADLGPLADVMQSGFAPNPAAVKDAAAAVEIDSAALKKWIHSLDLLSDPAPANWDEATQRYLALVALEQSHRDSGREATADVTAALKKLRQQLAFPTNLDSPAGLFAPANTNSLKAIQNSLDELIEQLQQRRGEAKE